MICWRKYLKVCKLFRNITKKNSKFLKPKNQFNFKISGAVVKNTAREAHNSRKNNLRQLKGNKKMKFSMKS